MDFVQTIKREHQRANESLDRLADTSDGALKTRERLSERLASLLEEHSRKEESFLYPALERHRDAHERVGDFLEGARAAHQEISRLAGEISAMPKDDEAFLARVSELKKAAQPHMREEERLLNPLRKALNEEEAASLDQEMAAAGEEEEVEASPEHVVERVGATLRQGAASASEGARRLGRDALEQSERGNRAMLAAAEIYSETAQVTAEDIQAIATCSSIAAGGLGEMRQAWMDWLNRSLRVGARASQEMFRCTTLDQVAEVQRSFFKESLETLLEGGVEILRISSRVSEDARRPIESRVGQLRSDQPEREPGRPRRSA